MNGYCSMRSINGRLVKRTLNRYNTPKTLHELSNTNTYAPRTRSHSNIAKRIHYMSTLAVPCVFRYTSHHRGYTAIHPSAAISFPYFLQHSLSGPVHPHHLNRRKPFVRSFSKMQIIPQPLPRINLIRFQSRLPIRQRQKKPPPANHKRQNNTTGRPQRQHTLAVFRWHNDSFPAAVFVLGLGLGLLRFLGDILLDADGVEVEDEF
jgi:hypothetical protein